MARTRSASGAMPLALELLTADHRKVEDLFQQFEDEKDGDEATKRALARTICGELTAHTRLEEELFYPWLRENMDEMEKIEEAYVEHASAKDLVAQIQHADNMDEAFDAKVKVLSEYIKHHVGEEENEIFPEVRGMQEDLDELGQEMAARKAELMEELGLDQADAARQLSARGGREDARPRQGARNSR